MYMDVMPSESPNSSNPLTGRRNTASKSRADLYSDSIATLTLSGDFHKNITMMPAIPAANASDQGGIRLSKGNQPIPTKPRAITISVACMTAPAARLTATAVTTWRRATPARSINRSRTTAPPILGLKRLANGAANWAPL